MADYWKSNPRYFCELCKCWMADNKPSRDFHERGKRHQESVKRKLDDMRKKGIEDAKNDREVKSYLAEMEREALKKFKQDLVQDPMLAAHYGVQASAIQIPRAPSYLGRTDPLANQNHQKKPTDKKEPKKKKGEAIYPMPNPNAPPEETPTPSVHGDWQEVTTDDGHLYYWNSKTGESSWHLPGTQEYDDYIKQMANMPAGEAAAYFQSFRQNHEVAETAPVYPVLDSDSIPLPQADEESNLENQEAVIYSEATSNPTSARPASSSYFEDRGTTRFEQAEATQSVVQPSESAETTHPVVEEIPGEIYHLFPQKTAKRGRDDTHIYGQWQTVKPAKETEKYVDLQLPQTKKIKIETIAVPKEKKLDLTKERPTPPSNKPPMEFKKRTTKEEKCQSKSRNFRRRDDDGDI